MGASRVVIFGDQCCQCFEAKPSVVHSSNECLWEDGPQSESSQHFLPAVSGMPEVFAQTCTLPWSKHVMKAHCSDSDRHLANLTYFPGAKILTRQWKSVKHCNILQSFECSNLLQVRRYRSYLRLNLDVGGGLQIWQGSRSFSRSPRVDEPLKSPILIGDDGKVRGKL